MSETGANPRDPDEWRVEVQLEEPDHGRFFDRMKEADFDAEARQLLGGSVLVTKDGPRVFVYAWHEHGAREGERVVRELLEAQNMAAEVTLQRWHPAEDAWRPAGDDLPESDLDKAEERQRHLEAAAERHEETGEFDWQVVIDLPGHSAAVTLAEELEKRGLPVTRHWRYLLVGALTEEAAIELGKELEAEAPDDSHIGIRANPSDLPAAGIVFLESLRP